MAFLTREQLEERLVSLHRASLELVRDLSLEVVLERIVTLAREEVNATYAALGVFDESGHLAQFIPVGMEIEEIKIMGNQPIGTGLLGVLKNDRTTIRIKNIAEDPRSAGFPKQHPFMKSFLGVPIILGDRILGQIYLTNKVGYPEFTADDERVIETLAAYAAVAINNARMYEGLLKRDSTLMVQNEDMGFINDVATALTGSLDLDIILEQTLTRVVTYMGLAAGEIYLREDGGSEFRIALHKGSKDHTFFTRDVFHIGEGLVGEVAQSGKPIVFEKLDNEIRFLKQKFLEEQCCWMAGIPLLTRGVVVGVMCIADKSDRKLADRQLNLLTSIAAWAGITIENAVLHRQARRLAVLEERERIGMDLHDGIIQSIYATGLALDYARIAIEDDPMQSKQKIVQAIDSLNKTIRDIRAYILDLRPRELRGNELIPNLHRLVDEYRVNTLCEATIVTPDDGMVGVPISHATALFHICQEALANAAKHAQARRVDVRLWVVKERVLLEVADDGQGFDLRQMSITLGHGLSNMHIRARKVGGDVEITSSPGEGTMVLAWVPRRS